MFLKQKTKELDKIARFYETIIILSKIYIFYIALCR